MAYYLYILASRPNGALYVGVTNHLKRRLEEHLSGQGSEFTGKYKIRKLVYYQAFDNVQDAIQREKQIKEWKRNWKITLIESINPMWKDLSQVHDLPD